MAGVMVMLAGVFVVLAAFDRVARLRSLETRESLERVIKDVPLPLNVIAFPGAPDKRVWASAGVARISHGPFPHRALMAKFEEMAREAIV